MRHVVVLMVAGWMAITSGIARADDDETVERFLSRLGLVDLQILHLEQAIERQTADESRVTLARRLADLYAERLTDTADDPQRYDDVMRRIQALVAKVPQANTTSLEVMLLQSDYSRAEAQIVKWIDDPTDATALAEANKILAVIAPKLNQFQRELNDTADKLAEQIDQSEENDARATAEQQLRRQQAVAGRATYFAGWANYYFGISRPDRAAAAADFANARAAFRRLLGIDEADKYEDLDVEWLGLESIWRSRALIGLGLAEAAANNLSGSRICFRLLEHVSTPPLIRDQGAYWYLQGLLNAGQFAEAVVYATEQVDKYAGGATAGKISFCAALVRAGFAGGAADASPQARQLGELGVRGLAKLRQLSVLRQLIAKYNIELKDDGGFYLTWIRGQQQFAQAEASKATDDYEAAAKTLAAALDDPQARADVSSAGDCRYTLAWCHYRLDRFEQAAQQFQQSAAALKESSKDAAVQAAWMAFVSYQRLSGTESRFVATAIETLQAIKRDFPASEQAKKADYYIAKLQQSAATPEESIRTLSQIKPGEPNYLSARYELCLLYHQQWSKVRGDSRAAPAAAAEVLRAVDQYLADAKIDADQERKLKCALLAMDIALNTTPPNEQQSAAYLAKAAAVADLLPESSSSLAEYHYRCWQAARQAGNQTSVDQHSTWLARNAAGSIYELPAIVTLAKRSDEAVDAAIASEKTARQEAAAGIYQRLVQLLGDTPETMTAKKNALVANSKLAQYEHELGRYAAAANRLDRILTAYPNDKGYLRRAGLSHFAAGDFAAALPHWRTLLSGLDNDADDWYEAKYYQLQSLLKTDKPAAKKVYDQFKLLHPDLGPESWKTKFRELESSLR